MTAVGAGAGALHVALLRGINVSGRNQLSMSKLRTIVEALGADGVTTYLQSGNVVLRWPGGDAEKLAAAIEDRVRADACVEAVVLVRRAEELLEVVAANPYVGGSRDPSHLHVTFVAASPDAEAVASLAEWAERATPDEFQLGKREFYLHCPNGYGRTKLNNAFFEKKLGLVATTRNWRTVTALAEMVGRGRPTGI